MSAMEARAAARGPDRRTEILDTAKRLFAERGFHATSMRDLCAALGMSAGNLYHWFPSKQAIIAAFVRVDSAEIAARFAEISQAKDLRAVLAEQVLGYMAATSEEDVRLILEVYAASLRDPDLAPLVREADAAAQSQLGELLRRAGVPDPDACAILVIALIDGLMFRCALEPGRDISDLARPLSAALRGLLGPKDPR
jgi:TetR/AcrR family transcriptional repressor of uid operon